MSETSPEPDTRETLADAQARSKRIAQAAARALAEAEARRTQAGAPTDAVAEIGGPKGPEPTRFGDWEKKGITHDF